MGWKTGTQSQEENETVTDNEAEVPDISDWKLSQRYSLRCEVNMVKCLDLIFSPANVF